MGFLDSLIKLVIGEKQKDIKLSFGPNEENIEEQIKTRSKMLAKGLSYEAKGGQLAGRIGDGQFVPPIYDLAEIARCADVEPYVAQSIRRHREQILKENYDVQGSEDELVDYINKRLFEISVVTGIPTYTWIREAVTNLVTYHNCVIVFRRDSSRSSGKKIRLYGKEIDPIAGIYVVDPTTMLVKVDKYGTPKKWVQRVGSGSYGGDSSSDEKSFNAEDVVCITVDKKSGYTFGTPYILPVLEDVRALRKLEELAIILANKEAYPLYHYKVGTETNPAMVYEDGANEIDLIKTSVSSMPVGGNIVTSERHEINLISKQGAALDLQPFLEYFEARVLAGLRLSPMELGRGGTANRACYSEDTETLTDKGWKHYWNIDIEKDLIATINPETKCLSYEKANSVHVYPYSGKMHSFHNGQSDCLVTPDHDMWVDDGSGFKKIHADQLKGKYDIQTTPIVDQTTNLPETNLDSFLTWAAPLYAYFVKYGKLNIHMGQIKFICRHDIDIAQRLDAANLKYRKYVNPDYIKYVIDNRDLAIHLNKEFSCRIYPKKLPKSLMEARTEIITSFIDSIISLEAHPNIIHDRSATILNQIQELLFKIGIFSRISKTSLIYNKDLTKASISTEEVRLIDYDGIVYCFSVPNHLFVTRRNGMISIHGNTAGNMSKNVQDAAKDYQEVFSNAITFGLFLPLLLEGGFDINEQNMVYMSFPMIDREELRAHQNHGHQLLLGNGITEDEFRKDYLNKKPMSDQERELTTRALDGESQKELDAHAASVAPAPAPGDAPTQPEVTHTVTKKRGTPESNTTTKKVTKIAGNKGQPTNQYGSKPAKTKVNKNDYLDQILESFDILSKDISKLFISNDDEITEDEAKELITEKVSNFISYVLSDSKSFLMTAINSGANAAAAQDSKPVVEIGNRSKDKFFTNYVEKSYWRILGPAIADMAAAFKRDEEGNPQPFLGLKVLLSLHNKIRDLLKEHPLVAERFGFAKASRIFGYNSIALENSEFRERKIIELPKGPIAYNNLIVHEASDAFELKLGNKINQITDTSDE